MGSILDNILATTAEEDEEELQEEEVAQPAYTGMSVLEQIKAEQGDTTEPEPEPVAVAEEPAPIPEEEVVEDDGYFRPDWRNQSTRVAGGADLLAARQQNKAVTDAKIEAFNEQRATAEEEAAGPGVGEGRWEMAKAGMRKAAGGVSDTLSRPQDIIAPGLAEGMLGEEVAEGLSIKPLEEVADIFRTQGAENERIGRESMPESPGARFATEIADSIIFMAPSVLTARATKKGDAGLSVMGAMVYGRSFSDHLASGLSRDEAIKEALIETAFELGPEKAFGWFDNIPLTAGVKQWFKNNIVEGLSEMTTEELHMRHAKYNKGEDIDLGGEEAWNNRFKAGASGFVLSAGLTATSAMKAPGETEAEQVQRHEDALGAVLQEERDTSRFKATIEQEIEQAQAALPEIETGEQADTTTIQTVELDSGGEAAAHAEELKEELEAEASGVEVEELTPEQLETELAAIDRERQPQEETAQQDIPISKDTNGDVITYSSPNGSLQVTDRGDGTIAIDDIDVARGSQKGGEGSAMYRKLFADAARQGKTVVAADSVTEAAWRTWQSLERNKAPVQLNEVRRVENENGKITYEAVNGGPVAQSVPAAKAQPITLPDRASNRQGVWETPEASVQTGVMEDGSEGRYVEVVWTNTAATRSGVWRVWENGTVTHESVGQENDSNRPLPKWLKDDLVGQITKDDAVPTARDQQNKRLDGLAQRAAELGGEAGAAQAAEFAAKLRKAGKEADAAYLESEFARRSEKPELTPEPEPVVLGPARAVPEKHAATLGLEQEQVEPEAETEAEPEVEEAAPAAPKLNEGFSLTHAAIDQKRVARGFEPRLDEKTVKSDEQTFLDAESELEADQFAGAVLVEEMKKRPRPLSDVEHAILLLDRVKHENAKDEAALAMDDPNATEEQKETQLSIWEMHESIIIDIENAAEIAGTESGRAFRIRRATIRKDFSLEGMLQKARAARKGKRALSKEEADKIKEQHATIVQLKKELEAAVAAESSAAERALAEAAVNNLVAAANNASKESVATKANKKARDIAQSIDAAAKVSKQWLKANRYNLSANVNPMAFVHLTRIGIDHIAKGAIKFADWVQAMRADVKAASEGTIDFDDFSDDHQAIFDEATEQHNAKTLSPEAQLDVLRSKLVERSDDGLNHRAVYNLAKYYVAQRGLRGEEAVMKAVTADIQELIPDVTERQVRVAFVNYDAQQNRTPDQVRDEMRDLSTAVKLQEEIDRLREKERRLKSDKHKSEINHAIINKKRLRDALVRKWEDTTEEGRAERYKRTNQARLRRTEQEIAELEVELQQGVTERESRPEVPVSPEVKEKKARLEGLKQERQALLEQKNPPPTEEEKWNATRARQITSRIEVLKQKRKNKDYARKPKPVPHTRTKEVQRLESELHEQIGAFLREQKRVEESLLEGVDKGILNVNRAFSMMRTVKTSWDASAAMRQLAIQVLAHPIKYGPLTIKSTIKAGLSKEKAHAMTMELFNDPRIARARHEDIGLHMVHPEEVDRSKLEEDYMDSVIQDHWLFQKTGVAASQRAFVHTLNVIRAKAYIDIIEQDYNGHPTPTEAKAVASWVNNSTGRGHVPLGGGNLASWVMFAPRWTISRYVTLYKAAEAFAMLPADVVGGVKDKVRGHTKVDKAQRRKMRSRVRKEMSKYLAGMGTLMLLEGAMHALMAGEDEEVSINFNPYSTDFLKLKVGDRAVQSRIDFTGALGSTVVFMARLLGGAITTQRGKTEAIRGPEVGYGDSTAMDVLSRYARGKGSPVVSTTINLLEGENIVGEERSLATPFNILGDLGMPLILGEWYDVGKGHDPGLAVTLGTMAFFGVGMSTYGVEEEGDPTMYSPANVRDDEKFIFRFK